MKIGILTFHCAHNYGAVLQAYALQENLKNKGHEVEVIDYRPFYLIDSYKLPTLKSKLYLSKNFIFNLLGLFLFNRSRRSRFGKFNDFIKSKLNLTSQINNIPKDLDLYIIGSDQIWNGIITKGIDKVYWGEFPVGTDSKKIAYAASMGKYKIKDYQKHIFKDLISNFNGIGVRELETLEQIQCLTNEKVFQVLDPTFLINKKSWNLLITELQFKKKYVLVYQVRYSKHLRVIAKDIAKQIEATVVEVPAYISKKYLFNKYKDTSPSGFLSLIKNAECIVTSSFHGTAFSIIFEKPFYTLALNDGADNRSENILEKLSLQHRLVNVDDKVLYTNINYDIPNIKLEKLKKHSELFLHSF